MNLSTDGANAILDGTPMPATLWCQLHIGNPTAAGTANVAAESDRVSFTRTAGVAGASSNVARLEWLNAAGTETITHFSLWSASSAGTCWWVGAVVGGSLGVIAGETIEVDIGLLDLAFTIWS